MELFNPKNLNYDFAKSFRVAGILSFLLTLACVLLIFVPGFNFGIDFRGGIEARLHFKEATDVSVLRQALAPKIENLSIASFNEKGRFEYLIIGQSPSTAKLSEELRSVMTAKYGPEKGSWEMGQIDIVGPKVGKELGAAALWSLIYTCILISIYMYWRFDIRFSPGAMASIFHDLIMTAGFIVLTGIEFSTTIVAALLTLAGYSINDTVVVYDRIREMEAKYIGRPKKTLVNEALNSTLSRTLMTSTTTIVSCIVLYFLGSKEIQDFALVLLFGIFVGTYSSVYIAAPFYIWSDNFLHKRQEVSVATPGARLKSSKNAKL